MRKFIRCSLLLAAAMLSGCHGGLICAGSPRALATLKPFGGGTVSGFVSFAESGGNLRVIAEVGGLEPGLHSLRISDDGNCSPAGEIPGDKDFPVGKQERTEPSVVELPALVADRSGAARMTAYLSGLRLGGNAATSIRERHVMVFSGRDDKEFQSSGRPGDLLACGVIKER